MKAKMFLSQVSKTAFTNNIDLEFIPLPHEAGTDMTFKSGIFSVSIPDLGMFETLKPGQTYQIELAMVVVSKESI